MNFINGSSFGPAFCSLTSSSSCDVNIVGTSIILIRWWDDNHAIPKSIATLLQWRSNSPLHRDKTGNEKRVAKMATLSRLRDLPVHHYGWHVLPTLFVLHSHQVPCKTTIMIYLIISKMHEACPDFWSVNQKIFHTNSKVFNLLLCRQNVELNVDCYNGLHRSGSIDDSAICYGSVVDCRNFICGRKSQCCR